jgi:hypothetical protein
LYFDKSCTGIIESLRRARDDCLLALQTVEKNLGSLRGNRGRLQIMVQLPNLRQQSLQRLGVS